MKIKIDNIDTLEIAKALKCGWLDIDKVESLKTLQEGYNPDKLITKNELDYYLHYLQEGWGYTPINEDVFERNLCPQLDSSLLDKWADRIHSGQVYRKIIKEIFYGLLGIAAIGGEFNALKNPNVIFFNKKPPTF